MTKNVILQGKERKAVVVTLEQYSNLEIERASYRVNGDTKDTLKEKGICEYPDGFDLCELTTWAFDKDKKEDCKKELIEELVRVGVSEDEAREVEWGIEPWKDLFFDTGLVLVVE